MTSLRMYFTLWLQESRCAYVVLLMAIYWFSEAMPVGVTALLPVVLFPLLDVVKSKDISRLYMTVRWLEWEQ